MKTRQTKNTATKTANAVEKKNLGGRPKLLPGEHRKRLVKLYVTPTQYEFLVSHQRASGYTKLSRFLHDFIFEMIALGFFKYERAIPVNKQLQRDLHGIAKNVNQLVQLAHSTQNPRDAEKAADGLYLALKAIHSISLSIKSFKTTKTIKKREVA